MTVGTSTTGVVLGSAELALSHLPGKATSGGHVYVISFDNGTVKVGSTINPSQRIRLHQASAAQFGVAILDLWVSAESNAYIRVEKRLIAVASAMSTGITAREWFRGVDFRLFVEVAQTVVSSHPCSESAAVLPPLDLWTRVKDALGVDTNAEAAARIGIPLRTVERLFANPESSLLRNVFRIRRATGISLEELVPSDDLTGLGV